MSRVVAVVPMRGAHGAKTRLAPIFSPEERACLAWTMLGHVLDAIVTSGVIDHTLLVTREPDEAMSQIGGAPTRTILPQPPGRHGLNGALELAREWAIATDAGAMLVLPGDLPVLHPSDLDHVARLDAPVVLAPDRHGAGTNALMLRLDHPAACQLRFAFGPGSFRLHSDEARRLGLAVATAIASGIACDLDTPEDWRDLPPGTRQRLLDAISPPLCAATP